jgi:hypothetical protein
LSAGENSDRDRALLAIRTHLARIEQARPLEKIADATQQAEASHLRTWFRQEFLYGLAD